MFEHVPAADDTARIRVPGLAGDLTLLHLTDSHMSVGDDRDPAAAEHVEAVGQRFRERTPGGVDPCQLFDEAIAAAVDRGVDGAALTGDIIHFPAHAGIDYIQSGIDRLGVPTVYTQGNHDWHFPHLEWNEQTRADHYPRFTGLSTAGDPACGSREVGGVRLIVLDNSTYQVSAAQVDFLRAELERGQPCLLFVHIPLYVESLVPPVMEKWKAPIVMASPTGWTDETRKTWKTLDATPSTQACLDLVTSEAAQNLAGVFCGHVHFSHDDELRPGCRQYVTAPGFEGDYRWIELTAG